MFSEKSNLINVKFESGNTFGVSGGGSGGSGNYERLSMKPKINGVELIGNKTSSELGLASSSIVNDILSIMAGVESGSTASKAYTTGDYIIIDEQLYIVTSNISKGSQFIDGTNCDQTTVSEQLKLAKNSIAVLG